MELSPREALNLVSATESRAREQRFYRFSSPHLVLWGVIWVIGYTGSGLLPVRDINYLWLPLIAAGIVVGGFFRRKDIMPHAATKAWLMMLPALVFYIVTLIVMQPQQLAQFMIFPVLCVAVAYAYMGIFAGMGYLWIGTALAVLGLGGYFFLPSILPFWLAAVGGGGLIASGLWLRSR